MLSIDSSTTKTGIAIYDNGVLTDHLLIDISDDKVMDSRFKKMSLQVLEKLNRYKPDILYIEETVVNRNVQCQRFLSRLQGVIYGWCVMNDCEFQTLRPSQWRSLVKMDTGKKKREQLKQIAIQLVKEKYDIEVTDDVAEAILIGQAAINRFKE